MSATTATMRNARLFLLQMLSGQDVTTRMFWEALSQLENYVETGQQPGGNTSDETQAPVRPTSALDMDEMTTVAFSPRDWELIASALDGHSGMGLRAQIIRRQQQRPAHILAEISPDWYSFQLPVDSVTLILKGLALIRNNASKKLYAVLRKTCGIEDSEARADDHFPDITLEGDYWTLIVQALEDVDRGSVRAVASHQLAQALN